MRSAEQRLLCSTNPSHSHIFLLVKTFAGRTGHDLPLGPVCLNRELFLSLSGKDRGTTCTYLLLVMSKSVRKQTSPHKPKAKITWVSRLNYPF